MTILTNGSSSLRDDFDYFRNLHNTDKHIIQVGIFIRVVDLSIQRGKNKDTKSSIIILKKMNI